MDQNGTVKGIAEGTVTITAATANGEGKAAKLVVNVYRPKPEDVIIDHKGPITLHLGEKLTLSATIKPAEAIQTVSWISDDTNIFTINEKGVITPVSIGSAYVKARSYNYLDDYVETSTEVLVVPPSPTAIKLNKSKITIGKGASILLKYSFTPTFAGSDLTVTSSKPSVVIADAWEEDGTGILGIHAFKKGKATITVKTENGKKAKCVVTVKAAPKKVTLYKGSKKLKNKQTLTLKKGKTLKLKAKLPAKTAASLTWTSSKPTVATVDENGRITALKPGTTTITVKTHNKKTAKVKIKVK